MQQWPEKEKSMPAVGEVKVPRNAGVLLETCSAPSHCLSEIDRLKPGDIQGLDIDGSIVNSLYLRKIESLKGLKSLNLLGTTVQDKDLKNLSKALSDLIEIDLGYTEISTEGITYIAKLPRLTTLKLRKCRLDETAYKFVAAIKTLNYLDLAQSNITDSSLTELAKNESIDTLNLAKTNIGDAGVKALAHMKSLRRIDLSGSNLTDRGLGELVAQNPLLEEINLSETQISNQGIACLSSLHSLKKLWLRGSKNIDEAIFPVLSSLISLEDLELQGTKFSKGTIQKLAQQLPRAEIHSSTPCSCHKRTRIN